MPRHAARPRVLLGLLLLTAAGRADAQGEARTLDLGGQWRFALDRDDAGVRDGWFAHTLADRITLPGVLQGQGYGDEITVDTPWVVGLGNRAWLKDPQYEPYKHMHPVKVPFLSQPPRHYLGAAWYQRDVDVPARWQGLRADLLLERTRWESTVWLDDRRVGSNNSLVAPHEYDLGRVPPGHHVLSVRVDNRMLLPYRPDGHSVSDALGATWNGIVGRIELTATSPVWLDDVQVYPDVDRRVAVVRVQVGNDTGTAGSGTVSAGGATATVAWDAHGGRAELTVPLPADAQPWDEFHPALQHLSVRLQGGPADDARAVTFGLRRLVARDTAFLLNGHEINLRGTHSGGDFPLTGYPVTDVESWRRIIRICQDHGLNHMRFHSFCPPEAAFTAADELGFYLQPECGMWNPFSVGSPISQMLEVETARMVRAYGNHPSYLMLSASNEPAGRWQAVLEPWAARWYRQDARRLYAANTGRANPRAPGPQYAIDPYRGNRGWFGGDYRNLMAGVHVPVVSHEVGQWCAYPDFDVIKAFTGYLRPGNYEIFRDSAAAHGVLDMDKPFAWASGKFQTACYKEEIEANLRTPGLAGFQLLDLHDYLGQGTALIGVLDPFWNAKGYVTPAEFRRYAGPVVPLARLRERVLRTSDPFDVDVEIAQFGPGPIPAAAPAWRVVDLAGTVVASGTLSTRDLPIGKNTPLGTVNVDLSKLAAPKQYKLVVGLPGTAYENDWNFWLYPAAVDTAAPADVLVTSAWPEAAARLAGGGKVLFTPAAGDLDATSPPLNNVPVFWNRQMNPKWESMLGLWVDAAHPALAGFPTEGFCDWQWTNLVRGMRAINIERAPRALRPIVSAVDDWNRNYKLGVLFECRVGPGRLMGCAPDVHTHLESRTVARQLRRSLLDYMAGDRFRPAVTLTAAQAQALWTPSAGAATGPSTAPVAAPPDVMEGPNVAPRVR